MRLRNDSLVAVLAPELCDPLMEQLIHERNNPFDLGAIIITLGDLDDRNEVAKQQKRLRNGALHYNSPTPADRQHCQGVCGIRAAVAADGTTKKSMAAFSHALGDFYR